MKAEKQDYYAGYAICMECHKMNDLFIVRTLTKRKKQSGQPVYRKKYLCAECKARYENLDYAANTIGSLMMIFKDMPHPAIEQELDIIAPDVSIPMQKPSKSRRRGERKRKGNEEKQKKKIWNTNTSGFRGVTKHHEQWWAYINHQGQRIFLGRYDIPEDAARAYDNAAIRLKGENAVTNFPCDQHGSGPTPKKSKLLLSTNTTGFRGVSIGKRGKFHTTIYHQGKIHWIGEYKIAEEAAHAYDREAIKLKGDKAITNFPRETYE